MGLQLEPGSEFRGRRRPPPRTLQLSSVPRLPVLLALARCDLTVGKMTVTRNFTPAELTPSQSSDCQSVGLGHIRRLD